MNRIIDINIACVLVNIYFCIRFLYFSAFLHPLLDTGLLHKFHIFFILFLPRPIKPCDSFHIVASPCCRYSSPPDSFASHIWSPSNDFVLLLLSYCYNSHFIAVIVSIHHPPLLYLFQQCTHTVFPSSYFSSLATLLSVLKSFQFLIIM